ncbi:nucleotidyltransferase domain protein [Synechococcus sp. RS9909]|nr:nucleotidyltransferase domain protein [Synechococcus sp. RS9909]
MTALSAPSIDQRLPAMADLIHQAIPGSEVRLFGSRARGQAGPDSDIDLLITAGRVPFRGVNPEARLP